MYVDTSCLVAFFIPEVNTDIANSTILDANDIYVSSLTRVEFISALNKKMRMKTLSRREIDIVTAEFEKQIRNGVLTQTDFEVKHFKQAESFLKSTTLPLLSLDALHLSICFLQNFTLFTFDEVLSKAAEEFSIPVASYSG